MAIALCIISDSWKIVCDRPMLQWMGLEYAGVVVKVRSLIVAKGSVRQGKACFSTKCKCQEEKLFIFLGKRIRVRREPYQHK